MTFSMDMIRNTIVVDVELSLKHHEDAANIVVSLMTNYGNRHHFKQGGRVSLRHLEMSAKMFDELVALQKAFPAFRIAKYRALRSRGILGALCGITVFDYDHGNAILFQYKDVLTINDESLPDPLYIRHPKAHAVALVDF